MGARISGDAYIIAAMFIIFVVGMCCAQLCNAAVRRRRAQARFGSRQRKDLVMSLKDLERGLDHAVDDHSDSEGSRHGEVGVGEGKEDKDPTTATTDVEKETQDLWNALKVGEINISELDMLIDDMVQDDEFTPAEGKHIFDGVMNLSDELRSGARPPLMKDSLALDFVRYEVGIGGHRALRVAALFETAGLATMAGFAGMNKINYPDSDLKTKWRLKAAEIDSLRAACEAVRLEQEGKSKQQNLDETYSVLESGTGPDGVTDTLALDFVRYEVGIGGNRALKLAAEFEAIGLITMADFAKINASSFPDLKLKTKWNFTKEEIKSLRAACEDARIEVGPVPTMSNSSTSLVDGKKKLGAETLNAEKTQMGVVTISEVQDDPETLRQKDAFATMFSLLGAKPTPEVDDDDDDDGPIRLRLVRRRSSMRGASMADLLADNGAEAWEMDLSDPKKEKLLAFMLSASGEKEVDELWSEVEAGDLRISEIDDLLRDAVAKGDYSEYEGSEILSQIKRRQDAATNMRRSSLQYNHGSSSHQQRDGGACAPASYDMDDATNEGYLLTWTKESVGLSGMRAQRLVRLLRDEGFVNMSDLATIQKYADAALVSRKFLIFVIYF